MLVCVFLMCSLHTRPRVQRAPGLPCALFRFRGEGYLQSSDKKAVARMRSRVWPILRDARRSALLRMRFPSSKALMVRRRAAPSRTMGHETSGCREVDTFFSDQRLGLWVPAPRAQLRTRRGRLGRGVSSRRPLYDYDEDCDDRRNNAIPPPPRLKDSPCPTSPYASAPFVNCADRVHRIPPRVS